MYEGQVLWGGVSEGGLGEAWRVVQEEGVEEGGKEEEKDQWKLRCQQ